MKIKKKKYKKNLETKNTQNNLTIQELENWIEVLEESKLEQNQKIKKLQKNLKDLNIINLIILIIVVFNNHFIWLSILTIILIGIIFFKTRKIRNDINITDIFIDMTVQEKEEAIEKKYNKKKR